jgi:DHA3 family macrolide efflux protein-like MFS transporter
MENSLTLKELGIGNLFKQKEYAKLMSANAISRFGDSLDAVAYAWMVYILTGSKILMGALFAVNFIPNILFSFFSGVFADRFSKKRTVVICDIGRGTVVCITAILLSINLLRPWHLFLFTILNSTFETFSSPARSSMIPSLIPKNLFLTASSFSTSVSSFAELLGAGVAGGVIALLGVSGAILIDSVTFFISALLISLIKLHEGIEDDEKSEKQDYISDLKKVLNL